MALYILSLALVALGKTRDILFIITALPSASACSLSASDLFTLYSTLLLCCAVDILHIGIHFNTHTTKYYYQLNILTFYRRTYQKSRDLHSKEESTHGIDGTLDTAQRKLKYTGNWEVCWWCAVLLQRQIRDCCLFSWDFAHCGESIHTSPLHFARK
jgi:hypothetical protein